MDDAAANQYRRARHLISQQRYDLAVPVLRDLLSRYPNDSRSLASLAQAFLYWKRPAEAEPIIRAAVAADPTDHFNFEILSRVCWQLDCSEESLASAQHAIALDPSIPYYYSIAARAANDLKKDELAIKLLEQGLALDPNDEDGLAVSAWLFTRLRQFDKAETAARRLMAASPGSFAAFVLGSTLVETNQIDEAIEVLKSAVELNPQSEWAHYSLGLALSRKPDSLERARQHLQESLRLRPAICNASTALERVNADLKRQRSWWSRFKKLFQGAST